MKARGFGIWVFPKLVEAGILGLVAIIYLATLVLGLGTLALQFVLSHAGGGADADIGGDVDDLALDGDGEVGGESASSSLVGSTAGLFFSMRFWTFALMAFGLVGTLLSWFGLAGFVLTLVLSLIGGITSGLLATITFRMLKGSVSSATSQQDTVGKMGQVTVTLHKGSLGKVRVMVKGQRIDLLAKTDSDCIDVGQDVVVIGFRDEHAHVEPIGKSVPPAAPES